uniref:ufm1-specific protease 2 isoform X2 n=1 Tax=Myxine glutinosa TaxID=7769 RepID=UPI00358F0647
MFFFSLTWSTEMKRADGIWVRLVGSGDLDILCNDHTEEGVAEGVQRAISELRERMDSTEVSLRLKDTGLFFWPNGGSPSPLPEFPPTKPCSDLLTLMRDGDDKARAKVQGKRQDKSKKLLVSLQLLWNMCVPSDAVVTPCLRQTNNTVRATRLCLPLDVLFEASSRQPWGDVIVQLMHRLKQQVQESGKWLERGETLQPPIPLHFLLTGGALITVPLPPALSDDDLKEFRMELHSCHDVPLDRPCFRRGNALTLPGSGYQEFFLRSPHTSLSPPSVPDAQMFLVQGDYMYYHYGQGGTSDSGWGCAYRSLQTIASWFKLQAYTSRTAPSHEEIQQALVDVGDKPKNFVGSTHWIGSIEVQAVLGQLFGISSRILCVSKGSELESYARELVAHFSCEGTPVMMGGGVLAHTILGVMWSKTSGETRFLVLDPHYTGPDDLNPVLDKGWCGWKRADFWDPNSFYNLCLPLRPREF